MPIVPATNNDDEWFEAHESDMREVAERLAQLGLPVREPRPDQFTAEEKQDAISDPRFSLDHALYLQALNALRGTDPLYEAGIQAHLDEDGSGNLPDGDGSPGTGGPDSLPGLPQASSGSNQGGSVPAIEDDFRNSFADIVEQGIALIDQRAAPSPPQSQAPAPAPSEEIDQDQALTWGAIAQARYFRRRHRPISALGPSGRPEAGSRRQGRRGMSAELIVAIITLIVAILIGGAQIYLQYKELYNAPQAAAPTQSALCLPPTPTPTPASETAEEPGHKLFLPLIAGTNAAVADCDETAPGVVASSPDQGLPIAACPYIPSGPTNQPASPPQSTASSGLSRMVTPTALPPTPAQQLPGWTPTPSLESPTSGPLVPMEPASPTVPPVWPTGSPTDAPQPAAPTELLSPTAQPATTSSILIATPITAPQGPETTIPAVTTTATPGATTEPTASSLPELTATPSSTTTPSPTSTMSPTDTPQPTATQAPVESPSATAPATSSPTVTPEPCVHRQRPVSAMLVLDASGSIALSGALPTVKSTALTFIDQMDLSLDRVGVTVFSDTATLLQSPTQDRTRLEEQINAMVATGGTDISAGIAAGAAALSAEQGDPAYRRALILLTDGRAEGREAEALEAARTAREEQGIMVITIGLGANINEQLLEEMADSPEWFFNAPTPADLEAIYMQIANELNCVNSGS